MTAKKPADPPIEAMSFEEAMAALEAIVDRLEGGDAPLEESIALYERGAALRAHCEARLKAAELRVEKIVAGANGEAAGLAPFATE
jgi:exodeoxyribonuclease VII small subunit